MFCLVLFIQTRKNCVAEIRFQFSCHQIELVKIILKLRRGAVKNVRYECLQKRSWAKTDSGKIRKSLFNLRHVVTAGALVYDSPTDAVARYHILLANPSNGDARDILTHFGNRNKRRGAWKLHIGVNFIANDGDIFLSGDVQNAAQIFFGKNAAAWVRRVVDQNRTRVVINLIIVKNN